MWHVHGNRVSKAQCTTKIRNKTQRRISVHQRRKKKKKKTLETKTGPRRAPAWVARDLDCAVTWVTRDLGLRGGLGRSGGLGLRLSCISLSSSSLSFFSLFPHFFFFFAVSAFWVININYFWVRNRVLETRFPCRCYVEKEPHQR